MRELRDEEITLDASKYLESQTDTKGVITFVNDYFCEVSGYSTDDLVGKPHNIIRHPDMPRIIFKLLWDRIKAGNNINVCIKNLAKDGRYYWVFTHFEILRDRNSDEIVGYKAHRKDVSKHIKDVIEPLYKELVDLEKSGGMEASGNYLDEFLGSKNVTIDTLMEEIYLFY
ncbi:MAG: PAS domain-containing protein [Sulfuricurvum sp.]